MKKMEWDGSDFQQKLQEEARLSHLEIQCLSVDVLGAKVVFAPIPKRIIKYIFYALTVFFFFFEETALTVVAFV